MTQPEGSASYSASSGQPGGGMQTTVFSQEQVNRIAGEARQKAVGNFFKDLGFEAPPSVDELKANLDAAAEHRKQQEGQKGDVERLTGELVSEKEISAKVPSLEAALLRAQMAGDAGLKSRYHKYVEGETTEEIEASINDVLKDVGGGGSADEGEQPEPESSRQGTGKLEPNPQQAAGGGGSAKQASMSKGAEAYRAKHKKE
jgi:hypothetical protein